MDYRLLLWKYIDHVGNCEGVDFLGPAHGFSTLPDGDPAATKTFTQEEWEELKRVSNADFSAVSARGGMADAPA